MAYYNGFPATYSPYYAQYPAQPGQNAQSSTQGGMIWVSGEAGAKSYLVAPNNSVVLFDSEGQTIYIKSADATGMPSMKVLDYTVREIGGNSPAVPAAANNAQYATKAEIDGVFQRITALEQRIKKVEGEDE